MNKNWDTFLGVPNADDHTFAEEEKKHLSFSYKKPPVKNQT